MINNYPFYPHFYPNLNHSYPPSTNAHIHHSGVSKREKSILHNNVMNTKFSKQTNANEKNISKNSINSISKTLNYDSEIIEILGIKLHQDDILLICLIFFLYQEGVKDDFLFIVLILLLLS